MDYNGVARGCGELPPMTVMPFSKLPVDMVTALRPISSLIMDKPQRKGTGVSDSEAASGDNAASQDFFVYKWSYCRIPAHLGIRYQVRDIKP